MATTTTTTTKKATTPEVVAISKSEYAYSIVVLCLCVFANSYLMISVFPYSGYMAIALIDGVDQDNCGKYAGLLASFFMVGRAMMAVPYGQAADIYGRKVIMYLSLISSTIFTLLFGLSPTFGFALFTRFLLGFSNGIFSTTKTMVSELANGNKELETQGMGIVMGMWAFGILFSPAISGYLSDPVKQYPTLFDDSETSESYIFFVNFKFFLPNLFGSILCLLSIISVSFIKETLPESKIRPAKYLFSDIIRWFQREVMAPCCYCCCNNNNTDDDDNNGDDEMTRLLKKKDDDLLSYNTSTSTPTKTDNDDDDDDNSDDEYELPSELLHFVEDDVEDAIRRSIITAAGDGDCGEAGMLSKPITRSSMIGAVKRRASVVATEKRRRRSSVVTTTAAAATIATATTAQEEGEEERTGPSIGSVWGQINTRNHLIVYWIASFFMVAVDEGFPLYCISSSSGLGLSESTIGSVISASGFVYVFGQLFVYGAMLKCFGLYGTIRIGSFFFGFIVIMFPISQYINAMDDDDDDVDGSGNVNGDGTNDDDDDELSWGTFVFLAGVLSIYRIFGVVFLSSTMVATNRTVVADVRATMNGLQTLGSSIVKGIAPIFAGLLVSLSFASGLFSPEVGSWFMWTVTSIFGVAGSIASCILLHDDDDDDV